MVLEEDEYVLYNAISKETTSSNGFAHELKLLNLIFYNSIVSNARFHLWFGRKFLFRSSEQDGVPVAIDVALLPCET